MKIAVVGCGAVGGFYGARLCRLGHEVHFLLRSDFEAVRQNGVHVESVDGDFHAWPRPARYPSEIGVCDLVMIALKTTANPAFPSLLPPLVGEPTALLTLQNGLGNEESLARLFDFRQILGGMCFVCLNRITPGVIRHLAHGRIVLGEYLRPPSPRTEAIADWFRRSGIRCDLAGNLEAAHWEKLVWNVPFNGLGVAATAGYDSVVQGGVSAGQALGPCLPTDLLLGDSRWTDLARELMLEVIAIARALGFGLDASLAEENLHRTRIMGGYKASTLLDFEKGLPLELESLFLEPLRRARKAGVEAPRLAALCGVLQHLDGRRPGTMPP